MNLRYKSAYMTAFLDKRLGSFKFNLACMAKSSNKETIDKKCVKMGLGCSYARLPYITVVHPRSVQRNGNSKTSRRDTPSLPPRSAGRKILARRLLCLGTYNCGKLTKPSTLLSKCL